jgi:uncharacterized lipoprotein YajG
MIKRFIISSIAAFFVSGCALTVDEIDVPYMGRPNITAVEGASKVTVSVVEEDRRTVYKDRVSSKKNGYGMEMAAIVPKNNIAKTFSDAVKFELENLGFKVGDGGKRVGVELVRFYNDFKMGFFAGDAVADGLINIKVTDEAGQVQFAKSYEGGAIEPNIQLALGENARAALVKAMSDIVAKIAQDKDLHSALLRPPAK